jgi:hypothetical protein
MARAGNELINLIKKYIKRHTWTVLNTEVEIVLANTSEDIGVIGAALAGKKKYENLQANKVYADIEYEIAKRSSSWSSWQHLSSYKSYVLSTSSILLTAITIRNIIIDKDRTERTICDKMIALSQLSIQLGLTAWLVLTNK